VTSLWSLLSDVVRFLPLSVENKHEIFGDAKLKGQLNFYESQIHVRELVMKRWGRKVNN
jgi:hypothetical protein